MTEASDEPCMHGVGTRRLVWSMPVVGFAVGWCPCVGYTQGFDSRALRSTGCVHTTSVDPWLPVQHCQNTYSARAIEKAAGLITANDGCRRHDQRHQFEVLPGASSAIITYIQ